MSSDNAATVADEAAAAALDDKGVAAISPLFVYGVKQGRTLLILILVALIMRCAVSPVTSKKSVAKLKPKK